jgi:hypothetical protein
MRLNCEHYTENECQLATKLAGVHCPSETAACQKCLLTDNPKSKNRVTVGIAIARSRMAGIKPDESLFAYLGIDVNRQSKLIHSQREHWHRLHTTQMNATQFEAWLDAIPKQCDCRKSFGALIESNPPRFDDWQRWTWEIHNEVNAKLNKTEVTWDDATRLWNWNQHQHTKER